LAVGVTTGVDNVYRYYRYQRASWLGYNAKRLLGDRYTMTFVVGENCIKCKHTDCVEVCPVDCFYEGPNFLVIHPDECIDCALCEPECPVDAIFAEDELPDDQQQFLALNADLAQKWPNITELKPPLGDAKEWDGVPNKIEHLIKDWP